jgi:hypothetical protein
MINFNQIFIQMKKLLFITLVILNFQNISGRDTLYYPVLKKSIDLAFKGYNMDNYRQLANCSERILLVYNDEWLPCYYGAYAYSNMSFMANDEDLKESYCDKAQDLLNIAIKLNPGESELYVLQSLIYFARMAISPMINGPLFIPKANKALDNAEKLNPLNPRACYLKGKSAINTPKFFGGGKDVALPLLEKALILFDKFTPACSIAPGWGKKDALQLYKECLRDSV